MLTEALTAARKAMQAVTLDGQRVSFSDEYADAMVRAGLAAFLDRVVVSDTTVAAVQRDERWSCFWSSDDAAALLRCGLAQLKREVVDG